jgi:transketolase
LAKTKCIVTAEEHNILGGLRDVSRVLALNVHPNLLLLNFGESGTPELMDKYKLNNKQLLLQLKSYCKKIIPLA